MCSSKSPWRSIRWAFARLSPAPNWPKKKGLAIVAGTQRRHQNSYLEVMKRVHQGDIGDIVAGECYWNGPCTRTYGFYHATQAGWSEAEYQLRNWYFYCWLSGDHIVEQHVHNLDVINWAIGSPPVEALGVGGRQWRVEPEYGNIYDHFGVRYRYRQWRHRPEHGAADQQLRRPGLGIRDRHQGPGAGRQNRRPQAVPDRRRAIQSLRAGARRSDPRIRAGQPLNEGRQVAESTLAAIMGRISAYTGRTVSGSGR